MIFGKRKRFRDEREGILRAIVKRPSWFRYKNGTLLEFVEGHALTPLDVPISAIGKRVYVDETGESILGGLLWKKTYHITVNISEGDGGEYYVDQGTRISHKKCFSHITLPDYSNVPSRSKEEKR